MKMRGELFTIQVQGENRTYFFNVKENRMGDIFLQLVESKTSEGVGFDRHAIVVFEDEMQKFLQGLEQSLQFIEKNKKARAARAVERAKERRKKEPPRKTVKKTGKKHVVRIAKKETEKE